MNANEDGLLRVGDWGDLAALLTVGSALLALLWWGIRAGQAADRASLQAQVKAADTRAAAAEAAISAVDRRLTEVERTMATRTDLSALRDDLQSATSQLHTAIENSSDKTVRELERLLQYALKGRQS